MDREVLIESMFSFFPIIYKRLFNGFVFTEITRQQMELLHFISVENDKPMSYYGHKMMISKSNLTVLADKLIEDEYIMREYDPNDRRVIILKLTQKGEKFLEEKIGEFKKHILNKISVFNDEDVLRLSELMEESRKIFMKLGDID